MLLFLLLTFRFSEADCGFFDLSNLSVSVKCHVTDQACGSAVFSNSLGYSGTCYYAMEGDRSVTCGDNGICPYSCSATDGGPTCSVACGQGDFLEDAYTEVSWSTSDCSGPASLYVQFQLSWCNRYESSKYECENDTPYWYKYDNNQCSGDPVFKLPQNVGFEGGRCKDTSNLGTIQSRRRFCGKKPPCPGPDNPIQTNLQIESPSHLASSQTWSIQASIYYDDWTWSMKPSDGIITFQVEDHTELTGTTTGYDTTLKRTLYQVPAESLSPGFHTITVKFATADASFIGTSQDFVVELYQDIGPPIQTESCAFSLNISHFIAWTSEHMKTLDECTSDFASIGLVSGSHCEEIAGDYPVCLNGECNPRCSGHRAGTTFSGHCGHPDLLQDAYTSVVWSNSDCSGIPTVSFDQHRLSWCDPEEYAKYECENGIPYWYKYDNKNCAGFPIFKNALNVGYEGGKCKDTTWQGSVSSGRRFCGKNPPCPGPNRPIQSNLQIDVPSRVPYTQPFTIQVLLQYNDWTTYMSPRDGIVSYQIENTDLVGTLTDYDVALKKASIQVTGGSFSVGTQVITVKFATTDESFMGTSQNITVEFWQVSTDLLFTIPPTLTYGLPWTLRATLTSTNWNLPYPQGAISFFQTNTIPLNGIVTNYNPTTQIASIIIPGESLPIGTSVLTGVFTTADGRYLNCSKNVAVTIQRAPSQISISPITTLKMYGQNVVNYTAILTSRNNVFKTVPTGDVNFLLSHATSSYKATLSTSPGVYQWTLTRSLNEGKYTLQAQYNGNNLFTGAVSSVATLYIKSPTKLIKKSPVGTLTMKKGGIGTIRFQLGSRQNMNTEIFTGKLKYVFRGQTILEDVSTGGVLDWSIPKRLVNLKGSFSLTCVYLANDSYLQSNTLSWTVKIV